MTYSISERETIGLCIALEAVSDIANRALLELADVSSFPGEVEVRFPSRVHQQLFLARLLDFAKESGDARLLVSKARAYAYFDLPVRANRSTRITAWLI